LAAEYLGKEHGIEASKETVRQWMIQGKLWHANKGTVQEVHVWRPRRSRFGELVHWDTSEHRHLQINMHSSEAQAKGDVSTLRGRGHFYFALTTIKFTLTRYRM